MLTSNKQRSKQAMTTKITEEIIAYANLTYDPLCIMYKKNYEVFTRFVRNSRAERKMIVESARVVLAEFKNFVFIHRDEPEVIKLEEERVLDEIERLHNHLIERDATLDTISMLNGAEKSRMEARYREERASREAMYELEHKSYIIV
jgi:hypothetical protein